MTVQAAIFTLEGALFSDEKIVNEAILKELEAQEKGGRAIIVTTTSPEKYQKKILARLAENGVIPESLIHVKNEHIPIFHFAENYQIVAFFDSLEENISLFKKENIPAYLVSNGKLIQARGKAPKVGKGTGRKVSLPTKVVPIRLPIEVIEKYQIDGPLLKKLVYEYIKTSDKE